MVQIPNYQAQVDLETPNYPRVQLDSSIGEGLTRAGTAAMAAGNQLGDTGAWLQARERQKQNFSATMDLEKLNIDFTQQLDELERRAPPDGVGIAKDFNAKFLIPKTQEVLTRITDPDVRQEFTQKLDNFRARWEGEAVNREYGVGNKYAITSANAWWGERARGISENPQAVKDYVAEAEEFINNLPNTTALQRAELLQQVRQQAPALAAEALMAKDPATAYFAAGGGTAAERNDYLMGKLEQAVVSAESGGDPGAISTKGAVGLMQVVPESAGVEVARQLGDKAFLAMSKNEQVAFLQNPDNNLRYGRTYLRMMLDRYSGDVEAALVGYNAGPANADKWLEADRDYSVLPKASETQPYVQRIVGDLGTAKAASGRATVPGEKGARLPIQASSQYGRQPVSLDGLNSAVVDKWELTQGAFGRALPVVSAFRDQATNAKAGGASKSQHIPGNAIDVDVSGLSKTERIRLIEIASTQGFTGIGVYENSIHLDTGGRRAWGSTHRADSVPGWARNVVTRHTSGLIKETVEQPAGKGPVQLASAVRSGFVSDIFDGLPAGQLLKVQTQADVLRTKIDKEQAATTTADSVIAAAEGDERLANEMLKQIENADVRKAAQVQVDGHFERERRIRKEEEDSRFEASYGAVQEALMAGDRDAAWKAIDPTLPSTRIADLQKVVQQGPVTANDYQAEQNLTGLYIKDQDSFVAEDLTRYIDKLTPDTLTKMKGWQDKIREEKAGNKKAATANAVVKSASSRIDDRLRAISVNPNAKAGDNDALYANTIRTVVNAEIEKLALIKTEKDEPVMETDIDNLVNSVFKIYPRSNVSKWNPFADKDVDLGEVAKGYESAGYDMTQAADALRRNGRQVNAQTLLDLLERQKAKDGK